MSHTKAQAERILEAMKEDREYSCRKIQDIVKIAAGSCESALKNLMKTNMVKRRKLGKKEKENYENAHTTFVYTKVIKK
jgi:predicted transcriptional regulator